MDLARFPARHVHNAGAIPDAPYGEDARLIFDADGFAGARAEIGSWPGYAPTPLVELPGLAGRLGIGEIHYKDEGRRFGLKSFKALGGAYAVLRALQGHLERRHGLAGVTAADLIAGAHRDQAGEVTVACATDGNHGRSVAWGAGMFGARCTIYLHAHVSASREREIARYGATMVRVAGNYDDSVRQCAADAAREGWVLVADTNAGGGDQSVPINVMQGYTVLVQEFLDQIGAEPPSHVFVPGGVGGIAAAVAAHMWRTLGAGRPRVVVVEPTRADCIFRSIAAGEPTPVPGDYETFMACLAAGEISPIAWPVLARAVDDVVSLPDEAAAETMRVLARGIDGDRPVVAGESGAAALAGLIAAAQDGDLAAALGLGDAARIVVIGSEGATDGEVFAEVVGETAEAVDARAA
ncbi:MAG: diaminopropionate ammonia-lyase [Alphaproteobacteria bacterium]|nr:diaminopropionate ammonia-lyase [Alphaproteobacteria bacterium]